MLAYQSLGSSKERSNAPPRAAFARIAYDVDASVTLCYAPHARRCALEDGDDLGGDEPESKKATKGQNGLPVASNRGNGIDESEDGHFGEKKRGYAEQVRSVVGLREALKEVRMKRGILGCLRSCTCMARTFWIAIISLWLKVEAGLPRPYDS